MKKWQMFEKKIAKEFRGRVQPGSGNQWYNPSDVKTEQFVIECKQTEKKSYSVSLKSWDRIYEEALFSKRLPMMALQIQDIELVVLDKEDFLKLMRGD